MLFSKLVICIIEQGYEYENLKKICADTNRSLFKYKYIVSFEKLFQDRRRKKIKEQAYEFSIFFFKPVPNLHSSANYYLDMNYGKQ